MAKAKTVPTADASEGIDFDEQTNRQLGDDLVDDDDDDFVPGPTGEDLWDTSDDEDDDAPVPELTVDILLSAFAVAGLKPKLRRQPLSAQANEWVVTTLLRVADRVDAMKTGVELPRNVAGPEELLQDMTELLAAVDKRELVTGQMDEATRMRINFIRGALTSIENQPATTVPPTPKGRAPVDVSIAVVPIKLAVIDPDPTQARDEGADDELAASIAELGVLQPITVYSHPTVAGRYLIDNGERRYRGALKAGHERIPAIIVPAPESEGDKLIRQVASNDGKRLKPMEEARTFKRIMADKGWNAKQLTDALGLKKSTVGDRLALLDVPAEFVKYFEQGTLSASTAPILRPLTELPARALARVTSAILNDYEFQQALVNSAQDKKPIPVTGYNGLDGFVQDVLANELREIDPEACGDYHGKIVNVGKTSYAVDVPAYDAAMKHAAAMTAKNLATKKSANAVKPSSAPIKPAKEKPSPYQLAERKRAAEARKKTALRRAHFSALAAKLPVALDAKWALFVVEHLLIEMHNDSRRAVYQALVEPGPVKANVNIMKELKTFAVDQDTSGRVRMIIQLLLGNDLVIGSYDSSGAKRIAAAAELAKFDLKKVKLGEPEFPASASAKKTAHALHPKKLDPVRAEMAKLRAKKKARR